jgi:predicted GIY-YIG superfamily endonuclease
MSTLTVPGENYCYILYNDTNNNTYNGFTVNIERRLRQHNCEIKGGAKYTTSRHQKHGIIWKYLAIITSRDPEFTRTKCLSLEWSIKYPDNKRPRPARFNSPSGRLLGLQMAMNNPKFCMFEFCGVGVPLKREDVLNPATASGSIGLLPLATASHPLINYSLCIGVPRSLRESLYNGGPLKRSTQPIIGTKLPLTNLISSQTDLKIMMTTKMTSQPVIYNGTDESETCKAGIEKGQG